MSKDHSAGISFFEKNLTIWVALCMVAGVLIGRTNLPLANEGDALFHVGTFDRLESVAEEVDAFREDLELDPLDDDVPARTG